MNNMSFSRHSFLLEALSLNTTWWMHWSSYITLNPQWIVPDKLEGPFAQKQKTEMFQLLNIQNLQGHKDNWHLLNSDSMLLRTGMKTISFSVCVKLIRIQIRCALNWMQVDAGAYLAGGPRDHMVPGNRVTGAAFWAPLPLSEWVSERPPPQPPGPFFKWNESGCFMGSGRWSPSNHPAAPFFNARKPTASLVLKRKNPRKWAGRQSACT